jgi:hypothetical protein
MTDKKEEAPSCSEQPAPRKDIPRKPQSQYLAEALQASPGQPQRGFSIFQIGIDKQGRWFKRCQADGRWLQ